jgi:O-antigen/teichoic acid export membrane protein
MFSRKPLQYSLISESAIYLSSNILNAAIPFALLPILTRYLSPDSYGEVAMFQTLIAALGSVVGVGVAGAANRKYYDGAVADCEIRHFIAACFQILLISTGLVFCVVLVVRKQLSAWLGIPTQWILGAVIVAAAMVIIQIRLGQWQIRNEARKYGLMQISQSLCNVLLSLLLVVALLQGAEGRIAALIGTAGLFAVVSMLLLKRSNLLAFSVWRPVYLREALVYGIPLIPHIAGIFLLSSVDRFIINQELGLADVGVYMVAVQLGGAMGLVFDAINKAYVPWLFERLKRNIMEEKQEIVRYTYAWFVVILLATGLAFLIGPWLIIQIAGQAYARAGDVIGWLALGQAFIGMYLMVTNYIFYSKRTGLLSLSTIATGLINIALLVVLIRTLGLKGAAISFSIAMGIRFLLTWWVAQRRHPMPWFSS